MFEHIRTPLSALFVVLVLAGCGSAETTTAPTPDPTPTAATPLSGPYLGQEPPGTTAEVFAPGIVSRPDSTEFSGTFSPDGEEYYFYRVSDDTRRRRSCSAKSWTEDGPPPNSFLRRQDTTRTRRTSPSTTRGCTSPGAAPPPQESPALPLRSASTLSERTPTGWSKADFAGEGMFPSSSRDGQMYITDKSSLDVDGRTYLATITLRRGRFADYERLPIKSGWGSQAHPGIAPDGSYLLFDVQGGNYLYVSFRRRMEPGARR